jgi:hypothetical protein
METRGIQSVLYFHSSCHRKWRVAKENPLLESTRKVPNKHSPLLNFPREAATVEMVENKAEEAEVAELASRLAAPMSNDSQKPSTSRECSSQVNCYQQLNLSNLEMISPIVIETINKSTTLDISERWLTLRNFPVAKTTVLTSVPVVKTTVLTSVPVLSGSFTTGCNVKHPLLPWWNTCTLNYGKNYFWTS